MTKPPKSEIIFPLYIYPDPGAWDPLFSAIKTNPTLKFIIIVNPNSGPGSPPWWPNADYVREIPKLNSQPNVRTVGYIRTDYCRRPISEVYNDIATYAGWPKNVKHPGLGVDGIFFDETPNLYTEEVETYLDAITKHVKKSTGILGDRLVIHNPGTAVDARLANPGPDITTVVEEAYQTFQTTEYTEWLSNSPYERSRTSFILHSVPVGNVKDLTAVVRKQAGYIFITDLTSSFYASFGSSWQDFVAAMAEN